MVRTPTLVVQATVAKGMARVLVPIPSSQKILPFLNESGFSSSAASTAGAPANQQGFSVPGLHGCL
jgi:hypothetical protein